MQADYGYDDVEEYKSAIDLKGYKEYMMTEKVLSFLFDNAVVTDTEPVQELNTEGTTETDTQTAETETEGTETAGTETGAAEETESAAGHRRRIRSKGNCEGTKKLSVKVIKPKRAYRLLRTRKRGVKKWN